MKQRSPLITRAEVRRLIGKDAEAPIPSLRPQTAALQAKAQGEVFRELVEVFDEIEQGTEEWFALRLGLPTASNFATIMAEGKDGGASKTRAKLLYQLAGEIVTGEPAENYSNAFMERGKQMEAEAREDYDRRFAFPKAVELRRVGFVRRTVAPGRFIGCSPDSLVGEDGVLEIKTMAPHLLIPLRESGRFPTEHIAQCQGSLWVTGRAWCDLVVFYRGMKPLRYNVLRDEAYIRRIDEAVQVFSWELRKIVERERA